MMLICAKQPAYPLIQCLCLFRGIYTGANTESYKEIGDKNRGVLAGQYFMVLTGPIFYGTSMYTG